jgi:predicted choloylglycine hydrolase
VAAVVVAIRSIQEAKPADQWTSFFHRVWPYYKKWFLSEGYTARPGYLTSVGQFERHMPELMQTYERITALVGGGDVESRFLSLWCPPAFLAGCSQIAWNHQGNYLLRNYDYSPTYFDGVLLYSDWLQPVIGMVDCTWGLLDGLNASGLAASLTFGGRKITGTGFGIPLVLRYVLETCSTVDEAVAAFNRIPVHMCYNVTLIDTSGKYATLYLNPDRQPVVVPDRASANHQKLVEWDEYAELSSTVRRKEFLDICAAQRDEHIQSLLRKFLKPPLYNTRFAKAFGTLYTILYDLDKLSLEVHWPERTLIQSFNRFHSGKSIVYLQRNVKGKLAV